MRSKTKTIVCLTLTLLILGCSNSDVANITSPSHSDVANVASLAPNRAITQNEQPPMLPHEVDMEQPLEVPLGFQPPEVDMAGMSPFPFEGREILVPVVRSDAQSGANTVELIGFVNASALKSLLSKTGSLKVVRLADDASDVQVVAVEATGLTLQSKETRTELKLYESTGFRDPKTVFDVAGKSFGGSLVQGLNATKQMHAFPFAGPGAGQPEFPPFPGMPGHEGFGMPGQHGPHDPLNPSGQIQDGIVPGQPELPGVESGPQAGLPQFPSSELPGGQFPNSQLPGLEDSTGGIPNVPSVGDAAQPAILEQP